MTKFSNMEKAKTQLVLSHPFFASILLRGKLIESKDIPTAAVDARGTIYYNAEFMNSLSLQEVVFVLAHECMHKILQHFLRLGNRDPRRANYAQDAVINDILKDSGVGSMPENCVNMPGSKDKTWEEIYNDLPEKPSSGGSYMDGDGIGPDQLSGSSPLTQAEISEIEAAMKVEIAQAAQAARMQGKMPAGLQRFVDSVLHVKTPWHTILERFMTALTSADYSWAKPNKRYAGHGLHLPSIASEPTMGELVLVVDTSGSIGPRELAYFGGHLNRILETCRPEKVTCIYCDSAVNKVATFSGDDLPVQLEAVGGGGTDMGAALAYIDEQGIEPAVTIVLTDGYTPWPASAPDYFLIVACTTDTDVPIGEVLRLEED